MKRQLSVSAAMITCNEQHFLGDCLRSLKGVVDEVIVVDTGSTDDTVNIATHAGAKLIHHVWTHDFAAARNVALNAVSSDWVLYIDADERLGVPRGTHISDYIITPAVAAFVRFRPKTGYTRYRECRLFKSDPKIRFSGKIHETMVPSIREMTAREGLAIRQTEVEIDHLGYDGDQAHKHVRNLPLLQAAVQSDPDRTFLWYHLTETLAALGRVNEADRAAAAGMESAQRGNACPENIPAASMITQFLARRQLEQGRDPTSMIEGRLAHFPDDFALWLLMGKAHLDAGRTANALEVAVMLNSIEPDSLTDGLLAFDRLIFEEKACELAALACLGLGRQKDSAEYFAKASSYAPEKLAYRVKAAALGWKCVVPNAELI